jgi:hypothetical protein
MAVTKFQPEVWAATLLSVLAKALVFGGASVVNRNYEGEISAYGDTVHIVSIADPTISDYTKDTDLTVEVLTDSEQLLTIDQSKSFAFEIDDIDMRQSRNGGALMSEAAQRAGFGLRDVADSYIAGKMARGAQSANNLGTLSIAATATDAYDKVLVPLRTKLSRASVPTEGRYVIVPPEFHEKLLLDNRFIKVNEAGTTDGLRNGMVGRAAGFDILESNNTPNAVRTVTDGVTTSGNKIVTSATAVFSATDVGAKISGTGIPANTTIASVQSATSVTTSANSTADGAGVSVTVGTTGSNLVIAGSPIATSYAEQINKVEAFRPEKRFADALKGLHLYGAKVVRPEALASASVLTS